MRKTFHRNRSSWRAALALAALLALAACGGNVLVVQGVTVDASATTVAIGATVDLEATVAYTGGDPLDPPESVTWSVDPTAGATLTTVDALSATFVATAAGTYTVTATNGWDPTKSGSVEITVTGGVDPDPEVVSVSVAADADRVAPDTDVTATATVDVLGGASTDVSWSVSPGAGATLTATGLTATFSATATGTYTITATSDADGTKSASVEVIVEIATRVNAGGAEYEAVDGRVFAADAVAALFTTGAIYPAVDDLDNEIRTAEIAGTDDDEMYRSERSANGGAAETEFGYAIPAPLAGDYQVVLHFAEIFWRADGGDLNNGTVGTRVFDVSAEGTLLLDDYDLFVEAGEDTAQIAFVETFTVAVSDGTLNLDFTSVAGDAKVNAIEVVYVGP